MMDDLEREEFLFRKYENGRDMDAEDEREIRGLASIGFFRITMSLQRQVVVVKTAYLGLKIIGAI